MTKIDTRNFIFFSLRISPEQRARVEHHSIRLGRNRVIILRDAIDAHLKTLDADEMEMLEAKRARQRATMPTTVLHSSGKPSGLKGKKQNAPLFPIKPVSKPTDKPPTVVPEKFKKSFSVWASYLEEAEGRAERAMRANEIAKDMRDRSTSEAEIDFVHTEFCDFVKARETAKRKPLDVVEVRGPALVGGDLDEA